MQVSEEQFHAERRSGIGGSDVAAILGISPYKSKYQLWLEKTGQVSPEPAGAPARRGQVLEPIIRQWYADVTQRPTDAFGDLVRHPESPELIGHIDGLVKDERGRVGALEIKAPGIRNYAKWKLSGLPSFYVVQLQHYLGLLDELAFGSVAFFSAEHWDGIHFDVERDNELIGQIQEACVRFWRDHVVTGTPPDVAEEPSALAEQLTAEDQALLVTRDDPAWGRLLDAYDEARSLEETASLLVADATERLKAEMGELSVVEGLGRRVWYKVRAGSRTFDRKALERARPLDRDRTLTLVREALPAVAVQMEQVIASGALDLDLEALMKQGAASRPFRVVHLKGGSTHV